MTKKRCFGSLGVYRDGLGVECSHGPNGGDALATHALVWVKLLPPSKTPVVEMGSVRHCIKCAVAIKCSGKVAGCVGCLSKNDYEEYHAIIKRGRSTEFIRDGLTKVPIGTNERDILHLYLAAHLNERNPKSKPLAHDTSGRRTGDTILTGRETLGRRWCAIYPRDENTMSICKMDMQSLAKKTIDTVKERVIRTVLPTSRFSQIAFQLSSVDTENEVRNSVGPHHDLLTLLNINLLWRGDDDGVREPKGGRQSIHMDGTGHRIVALVPLQCHSRGYDFFFIPKSHRINDWTYSGTKVSDHIPSQLAKPILTSIDEMIIFSEKLMHAGGTCSKEGSSTVSTPTFTDRIFKKNRELYNGWFGHGLNKLAGSQPTDVAVQFNFEFNLLPDDVGISGNGRDNIWTLNERWNDGDPCESKFQQRLDNLPESVDKAGDEFITAMKEAEAKWLDCMSGNKVYKLNKRKRK